MSELLGRTLKGQTKSLLVEGDAVIIQPRALYHGFVGEKRIPFASITAVQFKEAGSWLAGFIQFTITGGVEWRGPVNHDENALQFDKAQNDDFRAVRDLVQQEMSGARASPGAQVADELAKLAGLRSQGQKAKLLALK